MKKFIFLLTLITALSTASSAFAMSVVTAEGNNNQDRIDITFNCVNHINNLYKASVYYPDGSPLNWGYGCSTLNGGTTPQEWNILTNNTAGTYTIVESTTNQNMTLNQVMGTSNYVGSDTFTVTTFTHVYGCMDNTASNYNPIATNSDGSCTFPPPPPPPQATGFLIFDDTNLSAGQFLTATAESTGKATGNMGSLIAGLAGLAFTIAVVPTITKWVTNAISKKKSDTKT